MMANMMLIRDSVLECLGLWIGGVPLSVVCLISSLSHVGALTCVDYKIYEQVVEMTHRFKSIFYDSNE